MQMPITSWFVEHVFSLASTPLSLTGVAHRACGVLHIQLICLFYLTGLRGRLNVAYNMELGCPALARKWACCNHVLGFSMTENSSDVLSFVLVLIGMSLVPHVNRGWPSALPKKGEQQHKKPWAGELEPAAMTRVVSNDPAYQSPRSGVVLASGDGQPESWTHFVHSAPLWKASSWWRPCDAF